VFRCRLKVDVAAYRIWIIPHHSWLVIFYFSNRKHALIYSLEQDGIADVDVMPVVLAVVGVVVVVDVAVVHSCVSAKRYYHTLHSVTDMLILFLHFI